MKLENVHERKGDFFKVLGGTDRSQVAVMTIPAGGDSGYENSHTGDQVVYVIDGTAKVDIDGERIHAETGDVVIIPEGAKHQIFNAGAASLFFLNIYTPPQY